MFLAIRTLLHLGGLAVYLPAIDRTRTGCCSRCTIILADRRDIFWLPKSRRLDVIDGFLHRYRPIAFNAGIASQGFRRSIYRRLGLSIIWIFRLHCGQNCSVCNSILFVVGHGRHLRHRPHFSGNGPHFGSNWTWFGIYAWLINGRGRRRPCGPNNNPESRDERDRYKDEAPDPHEAISHLGAIGHLPQLAIHSH